MAVAVEIENVSKVYDREGLDPVTALTPVELTLQPGEFVSLVGPSGCGKTTLLNVIAGLLPPSAGRAMVGDRSVSQPHSEVGIVFQRPTLLRWLTVVENVLLPTKIAKKEVQPARERANRLLAVTGLSDFADRYPNELSGGMQQRAAIVRALVGQPRLLLMDEPFSALDEFTRETLNDELLRLWTADPMTVLFITHNISEAVYLSDRIGVMSPRPGRLDTVVEIELERPRTEELRMSPRFYDYTRYVREQFGQHPATGTGATTGANE